MNRIILFTIFILCSTGVFAQFAIVNDKEGHSSPTGQWSDCNELCSKVLEYYFAHQSTIPVHTNSQNVDVSRWKPLFAVFESDDNQQHVVKITKQESSRRDFYIDCEMLYVNNVLINGEVEYYTISTYTLHFIPVGGGDFDVRIRNNSSKTYTNENKLVWEEQTVPDNFGEQAAVGGWSLKVLEYYLAHKDKIETTKDVKP